MLFLYFVLSLYAFSVFFTVFSKKTVTSLYFFTAISLPTFCVYYIYNAPDVALTEVSIGALLTFFFFFITYHRTEKTESEKSRGIIESLSLMIICIAIFALLLYTASLLEYISNLHEYSHFYNTSYSTTFINNTVTAILASYRGFDTLGETLIIALSSCGLATILNHTSRKR